MKKFIAVLAVLAVAFSGLTACAPIPGNAGGDLLMAPVLNEMQKAIYEELQKTLDLSQIVFKYPKYGEQRSPFVFYDMNHDGRSEVVIFYAQKSKPEEIYAQILVQTPQGGWEHFYNISGQGRSLEFVEFAPFFSGKSENLIIGWGSEKGNKRFSVYSISADQMLEELQIPYEQYVIAENETTGISELYIIATEGQDYYFYAYGLISGKLARREKIRLYEETTGISQMIIGTTDGTNTVAFIDEEMRGTTLSYGTEVIHLGDEKMTVIAGSENGKMPTEQTTVWQEFARTFRLKNVLCGDVDGDGIIEVPRMAENPSDQPDNSPALIEYMNLVGGKYSYKYIAAINDDYRYMVFFPERWRDNVTIVEQPERQEWKFFKVDSESGKTSTELFRIRVYTTGDYIDQFSKEDLKLATSGVFSYYGHISQTYNEPLAVSAQEVEQMFKLI